MQINSDPQGALDDNQHHVNDPNPAATDPLEILANTAENSPDEPNSLSFDQAMSAIETLLGLQNVPLNDGIEPVPERLPFEVDNP